MSNPAPTLNQINAFNATQGTTIDFNIIGGTEVIRSNKIYIYDLSDNSLICTHLYVSTESIHELPSNTSSSIVYASGKSSADFTNNTQYYAQIQTFTDVGGTQGGSGLSIAKLFWCLPTPTLTLSTIPTTISTTSYNVSATYTPNTSGSATNEIQEFQFNLYSAIGALLQTSGVVLYGEGVDLSYNFSGLEVDSTYYVTLDVTTTQGMNVSAQSNTFTVSIDTPTMGSASVVNNGCDGYISVTSNLSSEYEHEESAGAGGIMSFTTDSVNDITELDVDFEPVQDGTPWMSAQDTTPYIFRAVPTQTEDFGHESDTIVGGTVAWNQLQIARDSAYTARGITISATDTNGSVAISGTRDSTGWLGIIGAGITLPANHVALICANNMKGDLPLVAVLRQYTQIALLTTNRSAILFKYTEEQTVNISLGGAVGDVWSGSLIPQFFDLTAMFGSTIADYIYSLEQATAGAGVAWFKKLFPKDYYAYDAGTLKSVEGLQSHDTVGFNLWDTSTDNIGKTIGYDGSLGNNSNFCTSDYIRVLPSTTYYFKNVAPSANALTLAQYDSDKNFIKTTSITGQSGEDTSGLVTMEGNTHYIRCQRFTNTTEVCINISKTTGTPKNGDYVAYVKHTYALDSDLVLRGIPKLDSNNNLYYDGDTYESDGSVTRKWGFYTIQTSDITLDDGGGYTNVVCAKIQNLPSMLKTNTKQAIHSKYGVAQVVWPFDETSNIGKFANNPATQAYWFIFPVGTTIEQMRTALVGTTLVYELATLTTETADPYTNPQVVDPSGTEEYVGSPIPVGHETTYQRICPISGWDSVSVDVVGKNLFDIGELVALGTGVLEIPNGYRFSVSSAMFSTGVMLRKPLEGNLTISMDVANITGKNLRMRVVNTDGTENEPTGSGTGTGGHVELHTTKPIKGIKFNWSTAGTFEVTNFQMEFGTIETPYQPYQGTTYTSTFPKYKQQVAQDTIPYITKDIGDTYADTLTENLVGGTIAWNQLITDEQSNFTFTATAQYGQKTLIHNSISGHRYLGTMDIKISSGFAKAYWYSNDITTTTKTGQFETLTKVYTSYYTGRLSFPRVEDNRASDWDAIEVKNVMVIDLTQMFGTTIADYIYSLEQATEGAGVAWFKQLFPNDYYEYNSGQLISVNTFAHVIKDANGNVLHTYPLDSDLVLRGIPKLDANNKLYYDGDVYEPDGSVTRKYGIVDLGTLGWVADGLTFMVAPYRVAKYHGNLVCIKYKTQITGNIPDEGCITVSNSEAYPILRVKDTSYSDVATFKSAMSGVYLVYELATPTTEQADPFEENQTIVSNGIEEYTVTEQGDVEMPVGHDSTYYATEVYGGTIDMAKGVLTITKKLTTITSFSGTFGQRTNGYCVYVTLSDRQESTDSISNMFVRSGLSVDLMPLGTYQGESGANRTWSFILPSTITSLEEANAWLASLSTPLVVIENLATPIEISLTPQQMQTLSGQNNIWSNTNGGMYLVYQLPITSLLVKRRDVADVSGKWLTLYSTPITQASDMDFTFIDFLNQYGKTYQYALVPVLAQDQSGVVVQIEGGYTVSDNVDSIFDGVYIADQTNVERVKAGAGYGNIDMNQGVGSITPIGSKYPIVITNSQNQYHNGSVRGTIVPNDFYSNGNLSRIDMVNKRDELEQFLTNKRAKIIKDWNGNIWLVMIMSNVACSFDDNYGMGMVSFSADWLEVGDPTNQQDLYNAGLINVGGV